MEQTTTSDGVTIAWAARGAGPAVVLVHGITESSATWQPIVDRLVESNEVITLDLRGHGRSGRASVYDAAAMASDITAVITAAGVTTPHLVGHSLGGVVVSIAGPEGAASTVNVDQPLALAGFKDMLMPLEGALRDPGTFAGVIEGIFTQLSGTMLPDDERARIGALRRPDQEVVLGVWELILSHPVDEIAGAVDQLLAAHSDSAAPYLSLFGIDPGPDYPAWLRSRIPTAEVEVWENHGHYPHLVDPDRFVARLRDFWTTAPE